mmetsp:Transcript_32789/g.91836  ORF Transcript_32789/g.91836 Transcript_32789/m.91836 type:complete len:210 (+) Transcript_32789:913-1542(+)
MFSCFLRHRFRSSSMRLLAAKESATRENMDAMARSTWVIFWRMLRCWASACRRFSRISAWVWRIVVSSSSPSGMSPAWSAMTAFRRVVSCEDDSSKEVSMRFSSPWSVSFRDCRPKSLSERPPRSCISFGFCSRAANFRFARPRGRTSCNVSSPLRPLRTYEPTDRVHGDPRASSRCPSMPAHVAALTRICPPCAAPSTPAARWTSLPK